MLIDINDWKRKSPIAIVGFQQTTKQRGFMLSIINQNETMSHSEIAKLVNSRPDKVKQSIERLAKKGLITFTQKIEVNHRNQTVSMYYMKKKDADIIAHSLKYKNLSSGSRFYEKAALATIEQLLNIKLEREFKVLSYRIDGYCIETNTAYEIDEPQHFVRGNLRGSDIKRQSEIEKELGCVFVRIKI